MERVALNKVINVNFFLLGILLQCTHTVLPQNIIGNATGGHIGHATIAYCLAKVLSHKYGLPLLYTPFPFSDIFEFDTIEQRTTNQAITRTIFVKHEHQIVTNLKADNLKFDVSIYTFINTITFDPIKLLRPLLQIKSKDKIAHLVSQPPKNHLTLAVHIRKGNGGTHQYDGELHSVQHFDHDKSKVTYISSGSYYPFDWGSHIRSGFQNYPLSGLISNSLDRALIDKAPGWGTKFPPEQYYVDQIVKISTEYKDKPIFVQIFTDDKNPEGLLGRIQQATHKKNITFYYHDNRKYSFKERVAQDMFSMARFDVFIRSQSYFARIVEIMGEHKVTIFPLEYHWEKDKLIMHKIFIKG